MNIVDEYNRKIVNDLNNDEHKWIKSGAKLHSKLNVIMMYLLTYHPEIYDDIKNRYFEEV